MAKYIGIQFRRDYYSPQANIRVFEKISGELVLDTTFDLYLNETVFESFVFWYKLPNPSLVYDVFISNAGWNTDHGAMPGGAGHLNIDGYFIQEDILPAKPSTAMLLLWQESEGGVHLFSNINVAEKTEITKEQAFVADGIQTVFTLTDVNIASSIVAFSDDDGVTWRSPYDLAITWGTNMPNYDDEKVGDGYVTIKFFVAPAAGSVVKIKYVPKTNKAQLLMTFNLPESSDGSFTDLKTPARMLDYSLELYK